MKILTANKVETKRLPQRVNLFLGNTFNKKNKEPLELLKKISKRYEKFMNEFIPEKQGVIRSVSNQLSTLSKRMEKMYVKLNPVCTFYENSEFDVENERFDLFYFEKKRVIDIYFIIIIINLTSDSIEKILAKR